MFKYLFKKVIKFIIQDNFTQNRNTQNQNFSFGTLHPVFILQPGDLIKWKQVAARFSELITEAAEQLRRDERPTIHTETMLNSTMSYANVRKTIKSPLKS